MYSTHNADIVSTNIADDIPSFYIGLYVADQRYVPKFSLILNWK